MVAQGRSRVVLGDGPVGHFSVTFEVGDLASSRFVKVDGMVDAGSTLTQVPRHILEGLGIQPTSTAEFELADGRIVVEQVGNVIMRLEGREAATSCIFGDNNQEPILGVVNLEQFLLGVAPVNHRLVPVRGLSHGTR